MNNTTKNPDLFSLLESSFFLFLLRISKAFTFFFLCRKCGKLDLRFGWNLEEEGEPELFAALAPLLLAVNNASISVSTTTAKEKEKAFSPN